MSIQCDFDRGLEEHAKLHYAKLTSVCASIFIQQNAWFISGVRP
jgi:hypothetical protein